MYLSPNNQLYIIPQNRDKPIKICFNDFDDSNITTELENISESERLIETLLAMRNSKIITTQQYRSIKGQARKGYYTIVHQFLIKYDNWYNYFLNLPTTRTLHVVKQEFGVNIFNQNKFGVYSL